MPWTLSCQARGLQISHDSSDCGLNAWVSSKTIERAAMLTAEDSCSTDSHIDRESGFGMLARSIVVITVSPFMWFGSMAKPSFWR